MAWLLNLNYEETEKLFMAEIQTRVSVNAKSS